MTKQNPDTLNLVKGSVSLTQEMWDEIAKTRQAHFKETGMRPSTSHVLREIVGETLGIPRGRRHEQPAEKRPKR